MCRVFCYHCGKLVSDTFDVIENQNIFCSMECAIEEEKEQKEVLDLLSK